MLEGQAAQCYTSMNDSLCDIIGYMQAQPQINMHSGKNWTGVGKGPS